MIYSSDLIAEVLHCSLSNIHNSCIRTVSFDSRSIDNYAETLFFAIKGISHDGHDYVLQLFNLGVRNFVVTTLREEWKVLTEANFYVVPDTIVALQNLAAYHRKAMAAKIVAITGSNGKTIVKEWIAQMLDGYTSFFRSPRSYNSQIGVPVSIMSIKEDNKWAIIEVGISKPGEMKALENIVEPEIGIFTYLGDAHDENFPNREAKFREKIQLFAHCKTVIGKVSDELNTIKREFSPNLQLFCWTDDVNCTTADVFVQRQIIGKATQLSVRYKGVDSTCTFPFIDDASFHNIMHVITFLLFIGVDVQRIFARIPFIQPIALRMEISKAVGGAVLIKDYYNSDITSFKVSVQNLIAQDPSKENVVILSDFMGIGTDKKQVYSNAAAIVKNAGISSFIGIGTDINRYAELFQTIPNVRFYENVTSFLEHEPRSRFVNKVILLKGANKSGFHRLADYLQQQSHTTILEVDLDAMISNLNYFRSLVPASTKFAVMVKAFSYGSGSSEIASLLQNNGVAYLMVAFVDEGVELRKNGITIPIAVMNPEVEAFEDMIEYHLEPEIYSLDLLLRIERKLATLNVKDYPVHLKLNTGMNRSGVNESELPQLLQLLASTTHIHVQSIFSHLVGSDEAALDYFTEEQIAIYRRMTQSLICTLGYTPIRHILNSAGIERFSAYHFDMVRLGIGLHGISANHAVLRPVSRLKTYIVAIRDVAQGNSVGYGRREYVKRDSKIAIIPIGYADGWNRQLSCGKGEVYINGNRVPIVGNICMDACMIDVTGIEAGVGDEVELFGEHILVSEVAEKIHTIPYEVLTSVSQRVKRIYYKE